MAHMVDRISATELVAMLRGSDRDKVAVVDVRDEDFYGGHIKGSLNIPAGEFNKDAGVDNAIDQLPKAVNICVVHCMLSQVRGPRSAARMKARLEQRNGEVQPLYVKVLSRGFEGFYNEMYTDHPDLFEDIKEDYH